MTRELFGESQSTESFDLSSEIGGLDSSPDSSMQSTSGERESNGIGSYRKRGKSYKSVN